MADTVNTIFCIKLKNRIENKLFDLNDILRVKMDFQFAYAHFHATNYSVLILKCFTNDLENS